jgi:hypothetical protein
MRTPKEDAVRDCKIKWPRSQRVSSQDQNVVNKVVRSHREFSLDGKKRRGNAEFFQQRENYVRVGRSL